MSQWAILLDFLGVAVFATTGALVASRKQLDIFSFVLLATFTGVGGGTVRDLILNRTVFWLEAPTYLLVCILIGATVFFTAHLVQRRYHLLLWCDAVGTAAYGALGAHIATLEGAGPLPAVGLGVITATFGGMIRDVVADEVSLILKSEIYATAALCASVTYILCINLGASPPWAMGAGALIGFALRAGAIQWQWQLPRYRPRAGRKY